MTFNEELNERDAPSLEVVIKLIMYKL